ncbi:UvrD-helicase domain-containing protein [uncultured Clostridium sp.]|uniref:UvrD-helicase domain-containing protein n=1 Tax=uncultured Clostridium sp. TaxID=59620 RepID=UPI0026364D59|nr:UvrD-helicase domain-containing protein [uncultured Clostridium sp.]
MDLKSLLNSEQYEAATTIDGQVLILAGAGSGKTRVLTHRIAHMLNDLEIKPYNILAITFTNKAAAEMRDRVRSLVGDVANSMWISTFHSTCVKILRREIDKLGYKKDFTIYDSSDQKTLVKHVMKELDINDKDISDNEILGSIGKAKDGLLTPAAYRRSIEGNFRKEKLADCYELYQKKLKGNNALDFDDLIFKAVELFKEHKDVLDFYQNKFKYIMIDEYQDTNKAQYEFAKFLADKHKNICVVGDDDQCLVEGTNIETKTGDAKIEDIKSGDFVRVATGNGKTDFLEVESISKKEITSNLFVVKTESGKEFKATANHITFAKQIVEDDKFYVYLMYKEGKGYRIGLTSSVRSRENELVSGLAVRLNGEQADKMWIIKRCDTRDEASYFEEYYSYEYGIPKVVFNTRGRSLLLSQEQVNNLFKNIDTYDRANKLMDDECLHFEYPHHVSGAVVRGESVRKRVNLTIFGGREAVSRPCLSHRISLNSSGDDRTKFEDAGFNVRDGQRDTFRIETERVAYDEAEELTKSILNVEDCYELSRKIRLTSEKSFMFMPVGSLKVGMIIGSFNGSEIIEDKIVSISTEAYSGFVYDINVPVARNYIANGVAVHNCIYAWRGADIRNILDFEKDYPGAKTVKLEENYRSKANILDAANSVIRNNAERKSKVLRTEKEAGEKITIERTYSDKMEATFVCTEIEKLRSGETEWDYKNFAVLYRTNAQSRTFEEALRRTGIPYRIFGGLKFYDRKEIKDILSYLKVILNSQDDISLKRIINVPKRSIGNTTIEKIDLYAKSLDLDFYDAILDVEKIESLTSRGKNPILKFADMMEDVKVMASKLSVSDLIEYVLEKSGYIDALKASKLLEDESRIENLKELVSDAVDFEKTAPEDERNLSNYLERVALVQDADNGESDDNYVTLMTIHSAKGLEFPVVFMVGMETGIFPSARALEDEKEMEEARRLCYVGITRAEEKLYMTSAENRMVFGKTQAYPQSDFIREIPTDLKEYIKKEPVVKPAKTKSAYESKLFSASNNPHGLRNEFSYSHKISRESAESQLASILSGSNTDKNVTADNVKMGMKVKHSKFGVGTIVTTTKVGADIKLTIAFDSQGVKHLMLSFAVLELV